MKKRFLLSLAVVVVGALVVTVIDQLTGFDGAMTPAYMVHDVLTLFVGGAVSFVIFS